MICGYNHRHVALIEAITEACDTIADEDDGLALAGALPFDMDAEKVAELPTYDDPGPTEDDRVYVADLDTLKAKFAEYNRVLDETLSWYPGR